jgi:hypothetical protein
VVSQGEARGRVLVLPSLAEIQGKRFDEETIVIAEQVGGMEDIPVSHPSHDSIFTPLDEKLISSSKVQCRPLS